MTMVRYMNSMLKLLCTLAIVAPAFGSHAQGFASGLMLGTATSRGPSEERVNDMIQNELGRREAMEHESLLDTGLAKGSVLEITSFVGELRTRRNSFSREPEARLRTNYIDVNDPKLGTLTCRAHDSYKDSFWYCKPQNPANPLMYTASWEPYFVPVDGQNSLQLESY